MYEPDKLFTKEKLPEFSPAVVVEPWRKALMDAAELIRERGHCKGRLEDNLGRVCAIGAIVRASNYDDIGCYAHTHLATFLHSSVGEWNDAEERTAAEVIAALEGAARS